MRKILFLLAAVIMALSGFAQITHVSVEVFYTDDGQVSGYPAGYTTYRIYAHCTHPNDVVASVFGNNTSFINLSIPGGIWNHPNGGVTGANNNCALYPSQPALEYDSYVTLGRTCNTSPGGQVYAVEDPAQQWTAACFNTIPLGQPTVLVNTFIGGAWFGLPGDVNCFAGEGLKVLIAQITTNSSICGTANFQVFPSWQNAGDPYLLQTDISFGSVACGAPGCTDPNALNYDETAETDNSLCLYSCNLAIANTSLVNPSCSNNADGSIYFEGTGGQGAIAYSFNGNDAGFIPQIQSNLANGSYTISIHDTQFDNPQINPNGIYGTCEVSQTVTLATEGVVFGAINVTNASTCSDGTPACASAPFTGGTGQVSFNIIQNGQPVTDENGNVIVLDNPQYCGLAPGTYYFLATDEHDCTVVSDAFNIITPPPFTLISGANTPATCFDTSNGTQVVTWTGGSGDVDFALNNDSLFTIEGNPSNVVLTLAPGSYTLYGQDENGCIAQLPFTISGPADITIVPDITGLHCYGDTDASVSVVAWGGVGPFTYSIDNNNFGASGTFSPLAAGPYTVYAKDSNGCTASLPILIIEPSPLTAFSMVLDMTCNGANDGSISILAAGGTFPYQYSIDGGLSYQSPNHFDHLTAGTYTAVVKDNNGCTYSLPDPVVIQNPSPMVVLPVVADIMCAGENDGSVILSVTGGTPGYTYSNGGAFGSNPAFNDLSAGNYQFVVHDAHGCAATASASIDEPSPLVVTLDDVGGATETGGYIEITPSGGTPGYTFEWSGPNAFSSTAQDVSGLDPGAYNVVVTDANGCTATLNNNVIITGVREMNAQYAIIATPNPTHGWLQIRFTGLQGEKVAYTIFDMQGKVILNNTFHSGMSDYSETVDMTAVSAGVYFLRVLVGESDFHTLKIIRD